MFKFFIIFSIGKLYLHEKFHSDIIIQYLVIPFILKHSHVEKKPSILIHYVNKNYFSFYHANLNTDVLATHYEPLGIPAKSYGSLI